ncbi:MAG: DNA-directed RNA polymerase subunit beta [Myxococcota bacterium]|jgi:DNA-directed RNA polymerase subunit beta
MAARLKNSFRPRKSFSHIPEIVGIPYLIGIQKTSFERFLQADIDPAKRENSGLQAVFNSVFPIKDFNETASLEFVSFHLDRPKYDIDECRQRGMTYAAPMRVVIRLVLWDKDQVTGNRNINSMKEQEVYFGEMPLMTENGTFLINGTERVVVSQLHRSPGVFLEHDKGKIHSSGKVLCSARLIPYRGSWLDFEFDHKDLIYVRIDRRRKIPVTVLLRALGYTTQQLLDYYYKKETVFIEAGGKYSKSLEIELLPGQRATADIKDPVSREIIIRKNRKFTPSIIRKLEAAKLKTIPIDIEEVVGREAKDKRDAKVVAEDIIDEKTGEVLLECNEQLEAAKLEKLREHGVSQFKILFIDNLNVGPYLRDTLLIDRINSPEDAILEIHRRMRPGDPPTLESATTLFYNLFFNPERYDLSRVGRLKLNYKFKIEEALENTVLTKQDILETVRHLIDLKDGKGSVDDIDHLGNRRIRSVGELLENQYRVGLVRMERVIKEKMTLQEIDTLMPHDLVNSKPVMAVVKEFFGSSQLSQFMDQTNPLSEVTHKRRLSALGPGGLTRERAGFEVRDVHPTHYGRICPIETPEGPNIGLIASLSTFARVNDYGFVETPYRLVKDGRVSNEVTYYNALREEGHIIAQATVPIDKNGKFVDEYVAARKQGEFAMVKAEDVTLMDVSPDQLVSVAAALVPFLENDDANRALMGSNMQRQAVPLLRTEAPLVGTSLEGKVARDSGTTTVARRDGVIDSVESTRIVIRADGDSAEGQSEVDIYNFIKYQKTNQNTSITQKPIVKVGEKVKKGEVIGDGAATDMGELALGRNVLVAFMPWGGYNFEDSILLSERVVKEDVFTSVHIEEFECVSRDTKLGKEDITRDIPNVGEEALKDLDESGIIRIGAEVKPGDILVGKITPKGETQLSPEEKLLRAIFGEKAGDVRDTSLKVPPGVSGTIIGARVFSRRGIEKDERAKDIEDIEEARLLKDQNDEIKIIMKSARERASKKLFGRTVVARLVDDKGKVISTKGRRLDETAMSEIPEKYWTEIEIDDKDAQGYVQKIMATAHDQVEFIKGIFEEKIGRLRKGDELPPGVIKMIKIYVASKRKIQSGDKMAGRHGNKGVISRILPEEDMPYMPDGSPVDIVLNPLGVPSRMNVGQILETHLGWAAWGLGRKVAELVNTHCTSDAVRKDLKKSYNSTEISKLIDALSDEQVVEHARRVKKGIHYSSPVFDGANEAEIKSLLDMAGLPKSGQTVLFDGRTGEPFDKDVTVGIMYMLKLHHLVDDKIHARSIGPYSLVTQQPLGGKAQFGGQRLGEMEVWAMEAYGAAYSLQEFLTVKSDDVAGRTRIYESIVKGEHSHPLESGLPESFNVLVKELQSLSLDMQLIEGDVE